MQKKISFLLALLLLLLPLSSCRGETVAGEASPSPTAETVVPTPTVTPQESSSPFSQVYSPFAENLYRIDGLIPDGAAVYDTALSGGILAVAYADPEDGTTYVVLFGIYENTVLRRTILSSISSPKLFLLDGDKIAVADMATAQVLLFDSSLRLLSDFAGTDVRYSWLHCMPDGKGLWAGGGSPGTIVYYPFDGGEAQEYGAGDYPSQGLLAVIGQSLLLEVYDDSYHRSVLRFDTVTHEVTEDSLYESAYACCDRALFFPMSDYLAYTLTDGTDRLYMLEKQASYESVSDYSGGLLTTLGTVCETEDGSYTTRQAIRVYSVGTRKMIAELQLPNSLEDVYTVTSAMVAGDGCILLQLCDSITGASTAFMLWDYGATTGSTAIQVRSLSLSDLDKQNTQTASELGEEYGIEIYIGDEGNDIDGSSYSAEAVDDNFLTYSALLYLSDFLAKFPDGMFYEMKPQSTDAIQLYLCGALTAEDSRGISSAAAIEAELGDRYLIAADIHMLGSLEQNLAHEFMHLMEEHIWACNEEYYYLSYWTQLVPEELGDSAYLYSYHDETGGEAVDFTYTWYDIRFTADPGIAWFIDAYSRTYPTEDRARVFEYLFSADGALPDCFQSEHLMGKAQYLCAVIRACFQSTGGTDVLWWERYIETTDIADYYGVLEAAGNTVG